LVITASMLKLTAHVGLDGVTTGVPLVRFGRGAGVAGGLVGVGPAGGGGVPFVGAGVGVAAVAVGSSVGVGVGVPVAEASAVIVTSGVAEAPAEPVADEPLHAAASSVIARSVPEDRIAPSLSFMPAPQWRPG
jgi:hypothetical protein